MLANYGYSDGSGNYFITIDTDKCNGCGDCVKTCPARLFEVLDEDPNDPLREEPVAVVVDSKRKKVKYECNPCKPLEDRPPLPCVEACSAGAISHSW
ncbi:MAG: 4Fe-4S dicluster domain-containing protein [Deltaproteobacteria bacterium]|nr:4Fe-4S dicluster domain-containing protein [Deltaproteobacteria bacterium]MBW2128600.1 4Fe-4S dicluster domain-containing protein [Deltaproteobacteria bacterium]MBW2304492.1 4Fe-4S dicluster domain-containing protein [Deltaproteobacteria bacterium]